MPEPDVYTENFETLAKARKEVQADFTPMGTWDVAEEFDHCLTMVLAAAANPQFLGKCVREARDLMQRSRDLQPLVVPPQ